VIDFFRRLFGHSGSSSAAKERLRLVLMTDHLELSPEIVDSMKRDLVDVISRYVEVDREKIDVSFERQDKALAMLANIPIIAVNRATNGHVTEPAAVVAPVVVTPVAAAPESAAPASEAAAIQAGDAVASEAPAAAETVAVATTPETSAVETPAAQTSDAGTPVAEAVSGEAGTAGDLRRRRRRRKRKGANSASASETVSAS
jgi:cell division topological specificity factor